MNSKLESIRKRFEDRRKEVSTEIYDNVEKLSSIKTLKHAQVAMLSLRQRLLEDNHTLLEHIVVLKKNHRTARANELESISKNLQIRYQYTEKNIVIDGRTSATKEFLEVFENQIQFFQESIKTIDSIIYGIKTRIDIEKTLGL